jgi:excisionase family DNA binding protein
MTHNSEKTRQLDFLNSKEVAQMLGVNVSTIKRWTQSGKLPCQTTAGGHRRFMMADLINLVNENKSAIVKSNVFRLESEEDARISYHVVKRDYDFLKGFVIKQALEGRSEKVQQILSGLYMVRSPLHEIYDDLLTPVLWELGDRWDRGDVSIIEEHIPENGRSSPGRSGI